MILFWFYNIVLWSAFAVYNWAFIFKKIDFHIPGAIVAVIIGMSFGVLPLTISEVGAWTGIKLLFICLSIRWVVFDIVLNILCDKKWWYHGSITRGMKIKTYYKNGLIDRELGSKQFLFKFVFIVVSIFLSQ